jgi:RHS repeat-associated protein
MGSLFIPVESVGGNAELNTDTTIYVNKYFETREHDAPTKYVWNGESRIAHVTGSLSTNIRVQRLRLYRGWNLCSVAVNAPKLLSQISTIQPQISAYRWDSAAGNWLSVTLNETVPDEMVLWLNCTTSVTVVASGAYPGPTNRNVSSGGSFLPGSGLEVWNLGSELSNSPSASAWAYDTPQARWLSRLPPPLESNCGLSATVPPGQAVFIQAASSLELTAAPAALRVRYYHQDHLFSSSASTDADAGLLTESTFYPFGELRTRRRCSEADEAYQFSQKESDVETELAYFNHRYLNAVPGRFTSVDPLPIGADVTSLKSPQKLNPLSYVSNRPLVFRDPDGLEPTATSQGCFARVEVDAEGMDAGFIGRLKAIKAGEVGHTQMSVLCSGETIADLSYGPDKSSGHAKTLANAITGLIPGAGKFDTRRSTGDWPRHPSEDITTTVEFPVSRAQADAMAKRIRELRVPDKNPYELLGQNCTSAVMDVLLAGKVLVKHYMGGSKGGPLYESPSDPGRLQQALRNENCYNNDTRFKCSTFIKTPKGP